MSLQRFQATITDNEGNILPNASVEVRKETTGLPLVTLYSDRDGTVTISNPVTADSDGFVFFHVSAGAYKIAATSGDFERIWRYVPIGTAQEFDLEDISANLAVIQQVSAGYALQYSSNNTAGAANGEIRFDDANLALASSAYVSDVNAAGSEITDRLLELFSASRTVNDSIIISNPNDNKQSSFEVQGVTDETGYVTLSLAKHDGETSYNDGDALNLQRERGGQDGQDGEDGADGEVTGPASATDSNLASFDGTDGNMLKDSGIAQSDVMQGSNNLSDVDDAATARTNLGISDTSNSAIEFVFDGGGSKIENGTQGDLEVPFACTIDRATLLADQTGNVVIDVWKDTFANAPPTDADSITASAPPTLSSAQKSQDSSLTGWTTSISAGDILRFNVDSANVVTRCTISLKVTI